MWYLVAKTLLTAVVIVAISELAKRSSFLAAALASVPLTSLLAFVWLYIESGDGEKVAALSQNIFWLVIPSLVMFVLLPILLRTGLNFWLSLLAACGATALAYGITTWLLAKAGMQI